MIATACKLTQQMCLSRVLKALGVTRSACSVRWKNEVIRPCPKFKAVLDALAEIVRVVAREFPWWG